MTAVTEQRKVLLEIADLKVHFDIKDGKQWFWQPRRLEQHVLAGGSAILTTHQPLRPLACALRTLRLGIGGEGHA